jgi:hypothetical protein
MTPYAPSEDSMPIFRFIEPAGLSQGPEIVFGRAFSITEGFLTLL